MARNLTVVAWSQAKPGKEAELRAALMHLIEPTRREAGCVQYDLHEHTDRPGSFVFFENWESKEHLDRHAASAHIAAFRERAGDLVAEPPRVETYWRIA